MTDSTPADTETDLAYLKRLATAGRGEPAPFLLLMAVFGGVYGSALVFIMATFSGGAEPMSATGPLVTFARFYLWPCAHLVFGLTVLWTAWRTLGPNRIRLSRAASATWTAAFIALVTVLVAFRLYAGDEPPTDQVYTAYMLPPVLLVLWGCAWWVTAIMSERRWLLAVAAGSFASAIVVAWQGNAFTLLPMAAGCLLLLAFLPAVLLMRERRG